jgi:histone H3/H4
MSLVVTSAIKGVLKKHGMNCSGDLPEAVSKEVEALLEKAVARAQSNGRKTVRPGDL